MSILLWDPFRPSRIVDQQFGLGLDPEDLLSPLTLTQPCQSRVARWPIENYFRPWKSQAALRDTGSTVTADNDKFEVNLDVQHFKPDELKVTASDNTLTIEGKHEEKQDEHGFIYRHFVRKYVLPEGHDIGQVHSSLSSDGVLTLTAPKMAIGEPHQKTIPIQQTGQPSRPIENKKEEKKIK